MRQAAGHVQSAQRPCTSDRPTQHSSLNCTTGLLYPFPHSFARVDRKDAGMGRKPCVRMLLGGAEFPGLGAAFMFPADAQPEGEVPHTRRLSRHPFPPSPAARPAGGPPGDRLDPQKAPRQKARGLFANKRETIVKAHNAGVCILAAGELKLPDPGGILNTPNHWAGGGTPP